MIDKNITPGHWKVLKLKDIGQIVSGGTPSTKTAKYWDGGISWITPADLSGYKEKYIGKGRKSITEAGLNNSSAKLMPKGSVLFSSRAPIGYVAIASQQLCTNQGFKSVIPKQEILSSYLYYYLKASKNEAEKVASGTTFKEISLKNFAALTIPLPPLSEQQGIVSKIEELFSELDKGKEQLETARQQLKVYRQAVLKWAFEGRLTNAEVKEGELPEGWKMVHPVDVALKEKYSIGIGPFGSNLKTSDYTDEGAPLIFVKNITRNNFDLVKRFISKKKFNELYAHQVKPGDILITKMGDPPGDCTIYPYNKEEAVLTADCLKLRVDNEVASTEFIKYILQSKGVKRQIEAVTIGVAQKKISVERFKSIEFLLPTLEEQNRIVQEIESRLSVCDKVDETIAQSLQQAETVRQSILKRAFEGKLN